jgi:hypothetical protein
MLYHYTSAFHLPLILKSGFLKLTESNLLMPTSYEDSLPKEISQLYKPVVWLTSDYAPSKLGMETDFLNKHEIRITVREHKHYEPWLVWSRNNRIKKSWAKILENGCNPNSWYISESTIFLNNEELLKIENTITGEILIDTAAGITKCQSEVITIAKISMQFLEPFYKKANVKIGDVVNFEI